MSCYMCRVLVRPTERKRLSAAVAQLTLSPSGNVVALCHAHLDDWFDIGDNNGSPEPSVLRWLPQATGTLAELSDR